MPDEDFTVVPPTYQPIIRQSREKVSANGPGTLGSGSIHHQGPAESTPMCRLHRMQASWWAQRWSKRHSAVVDLSLFRKGI